MQKHKRFPVWGLFLPPLLVLLAIGLVATRWPLPGNSTNTASQPNPARRSTAFFAPNHVGADARTVAAMLRYLVAPEPTLPATNGVAATG